MSHFGSNLVHALFLFLACVPIGSGLFILYRTFPLLLEIFNQTNMPLYQDRGADTKDLVHLVLQMILGISFLLGGVCILAHIIA
jgi:hypothetical protein